VSGTDPRKILPFKAAVAKYTAEHHIVKRAAVLDTFLQMDHELCAGEKEAMKSIMEGIDKDITRAFEHGTNKCARKYKTPWSPKLMNAKRIIRYWKMWESEIKNKVDHGQQRKDLVEAIKWEDDKPPIFDKGTKHLPNKRIKEKSGKGI
jgi:hypothetical protein